MQTSSKYPKEMKSNSVFWKSWITLFTLPAIIGIVCWIGSWVNPSQKYHYGAVVTLCLEVGFVYMIWIGLITSTVALIFTYKKKSKDWRSYVSYFLNGIWLAVAVTAFGMVCYIKTVDKTLMDVHKKNLSQTSKK